MTLEVDFIVLSKASLFLSTFNPAPWDIFLSLTNLFISFVYAPTNKEILSRLDFKDDIGTLTVELEIYSSSINTSPD